MRALGLLCGAITLQVGLRDREAYAPELRIPETDSTLGILRYLRHLWSEMPHRQAEIIQVGLVLSRLLPAASHTPDLFLSGENEDKHKRLDVALDSLRSRYGRDVVHLGSVSEAKDSAPMRISFTHIPDIGLEGDGLEYPA
jgi:DNA polymerase-4